MLWFFNN